MHATVGVDQSLSEAPFSLEELSSPQGNLPSKKKQLQPDGLQVSQNKQKNGVPAILGTGSSLVGNLIKLKHFGRRMQGVGFRIWWAVKSSAEDSR